MQKNSYLKKYLIKCTAATLIIFFLVTSVSLNPNQASAASLSRLLIAPFGTTKTSPQISSLSVCCNGLKFDIQQSGGSAAGGAAGNTSAASKAQSVQDKNLPGSYIFPWLNMIPIPTIGTGFYKWWLIRPNAIVLGNRYKTGICITIASECESTDSTDFTVLSIGTNLFDSK